MRSTRRFRWVAIPAAVALAFVLAGCTQAQLNGYLPGHIEGAPPATNQTDRITGLWVTSWTVLLVVGLVAWGLIIWTMVVYRRRKGQTGLPAQMRYNMPIEIFYTVVPLILVLGFFAFSARDSYEIESRFENPDVNIQVLAKQWAWDFNYQDENVYSPGIQAQPVDTGPQGSVDEAALPTLYLPVGRSVEIQLDSRDVVHSFWVPDFLYKKDILPGLTNYMSIIPEREGLFMGKCAELCGEYHSMMLFNVKVVSQADYDAHIASLRAAGYEGQLGVEFDRNTNLPGVTAPDDSEK